MVNSIGRAVVQTSRRWPHKSPALSRLVENEKPPVIDKEHFQPLGTWSAEKLQSSQDKNPFMLTWDSGKARDSIPHISHGDGIYLVDVNGKKYVDWTSQAVCTNLGQTLPRTKVEAAAYQMQKLPFLYGAMGIPEVRTRLNQLMNEILPGDLCAAVFPSSGSEANEAGIMMARRYTGRDKIISLYRGYHGATSGALSATGDFRRWYGREQSSGFVKAFSPFQLFWQIGGETEDEKVQMCLNMLEEQILNEGPETIASVLIESVMGSAGCFVMPPGYMQGVRAICDKYGILLHCDEVMVGFGRTGKLFGFQHYDGVLPDIVSMAKGISASAVPLSMTACSKDILDHFDETPLGWGSTYQAHAVAMACAYENVKYLMEQNIVGRVQKLAPVFEENMAQLAATHPSIKQYRAIGLFGCFDVHDVDGSNPKLQHEAPTEAFLKYKRAYTENGLIGLHRYPHIHVAPPLIINENELNDGFNRHDNALDTLDEALGHELPDDSFTRTA